MKIRVLLFGPAAGATGATHITLDAPAPVTPRSVLASLADRPALRPLLAGARIAVNHEFVAPEHAIGERDELALIALVSGG
jgi:MoaE-MoaD fusion protein